MPAVGDIQRRPPCSARCLKPGRSRSHARLPPQRQRAPSSSSNAGMDTTTERSRVLLQTEHTRSGALSSPTRAQNAGRRPRPRKNRRRHAAPCRTTGSRRHITSRRPAGRRRPLARPPPPPRPRRLPLTCPGAQSSATAGGWRPLTTCFPRPGRTHRQTRPGSRRHRGGPPRPASRPCRSRPFLWGRACVCGGGEGEQTGARGRACGWVGSCFEGGQGRLPRMPTLALGACVRQPARPEVDCTAGHAWCRRRGKEKKSISSKL